VKNVAAPTVDLNEFFLGQEAIFPKHCIELLPALLRLYHSMRIEFWMELFQFSDYLVGFVSLSMTDLSDASVAQIAERVGRLRRTGDVVVLSIHWGPNWGFEIPVEHRRFAHELIDNAGVSIVHGHSSHHPIAMEVYRNRLILYGCGDFLNDYEGISGYEEFLDDLTLMYFASVDLTSGNLTELDMMPLQMRRFQLVYASSEDTDLLLEMLDQESRKFGTRIVRKPDGRLALSWPHDQTERRRESALHE
jgi:hypothetical protein